MSKTLRNRLIVVVLLVLGSVWALLPRTVTVRERGADGVMRDVQIRRVPPKKGLDLQGGMHLALELDESQRVSADRARDIDLALTVLRKRIDEFGVTEPLIQKVGDDRIVVELAGITDPARAKGIVQRSAFLEFRITDETSALEKALPAMDRILRGMGIRGDTTTQPSAVEQLLGGDSAKKAAADSGKKPAADTGRKAAADTAAAGPVCGTRACQVAALTAYLISGASLAIRDRVAAGRPAEPVGGRAVTVRSSAAVRRVMLPLAAAAAAA